MSETVKLLYALRRIGNYSASSGEIPETFCDGIKLSVRAANAALCYSLLEEAAAERRRMGLKFYKQDVYHI